MQSDSKSNCSFIGLLNEELFILLGQGAAKLQEFKVGDTKKNPGLEPGQNSSGAERANWQKFFSDLQL